MSKLTKITSIKSFNRKTVSDTQPELLECTKWFCAQILNGYIPTDGTLPLFAPVITTAHTVRCKVSMDVRKQITVRNSLLRALCTWTHCLKTFLLLFSQRISQK